MTPAATSAALITQVELALLAGRNLEQIESEILEYWEADEDLQAAAWLYAWSCTDGAPALASGGRVLERKYRRCHSPSDRRDR